MWLGFRASRKPASSSHPYGYERAEDLAGLGVSIAIWLSAAFAAIVSYHKLVEHGMTTHVPFAMGAAAVGMIGNQLVARYKMKIGRRIQSAALTSDARHSWLDAVSSLGALVELIAVAAGAPWATPLLDS